MQKQTLPQSLHLLFIAAMIAMLIMSMAPAQAAHAQETSTSDLAVTLVSLPKHVKACDVFEAVYAVTNLGPDSAYNIEALIHIPDAYQDIATVGLPASLDVGKTATFTVVIWVGGFVPGELRSAWAGVTVYSNIYPDVSMDPNLENNEVRTPMKIIGKHVDSCPFRP
jgi:hypothetical protein